MKFGVQLYSLRDEVSIKGMKAVLKEVKEAGYDGVEYAGFGDLTPKEAYEETVKLGLIPMGAHIGIQEMLDTENITNLINLFKFPTLTVPALDMTDRENHGKTAIPKFKKVVETIGNLTKICYHNHNFEFGNGGDTIKNFLNNVPGMFAELDIFWLVDCKINPVEYMKSIKGRIGALHLKEMSVNGSADFNPVLCEGVSDTANVIKTAKELGVEWGVLEVEKFNLPTKQYLVKSLENMKKC